MKAALIAKLQIILIFLSFAAVAKDTNNLIKNAGFESSNIKPWEVLGHGAELSDQNPRSGKQSVVLKSGSVVKTTVKLVQRSKYRLSGWIKTASGSDEVSLGVNGLESNNVSIASALTNWKKVELEFVTGEGQADAVVEITNPENMSGNLAWADDISLEYAGVYTTDKIAGIKPLEKRVPITDLGIEQQPNSKLEWLLDARFGMFIHWGLYAGPAKGEWYMENKGIKPEEYRKLAYPESGDHYFTADNFNAYSWAQLAEDAGMKYVCLTTMHHDGFALFKSKAQDPFTSKQTLNRDFVKEYVNSLRSHGLKVGLYKTLINWRYPGYYDISGTGCKPNNFGYTTDSSHKENAIEMKNELYCQVKELMTNYGKIDLIFWDGGWVGQQGSDADGSFFWEPGKFLDTKNQWPVRSCFQDTDIVTGKPLGLMGIVRKYQPDVIVNSRSGWYGDIRSEEGGQPVTGPIRSKEVWEKCLTMAPGWGYTPAHEDSTRVISFGGVKRMLSDCMIRNMALLLNVAPDRHGRISEAEQNVLRQTGKWLSLVGEAVYGTRGGPWNPRDGEYGYTYNGNTVYIYLLKDFNSRKFVLPALNKNQKVIRAWSVTDGAKINFKRNGSSETVLSDFERTDQVVTILAVELNNAVMPEL